MLPNIEIYITDYWTILFKMSIRIGAKPRRQPLTIKSNRCLLEDQIRRFNEITQMQEYLDKRSALDLYRIRGIIDGLDGGIRSGADSIDQSLFNLNQMKMIVIKVEPKDIRLSASAQRVLVDIRSNRKAAQLAGAIFIDHLDR